MHQRSFLAIGSWVGIGLAVWTVAWIIAESIPVFNDLLSLIVQCQVCIFNGHLYLHSLQSSLFGSMLCCEFTSPFGAPVESLIDFTDASPALFWLHMNRGQYFSTPSKGFLTFCNLSILAIAFGIVRSAQLKCFDVCSDDCFTVRHGFVRLWESHQ